MAMEGSSKDSVSFEERYTLDCLPSLAVLVLFTYGVILIISLLKSFWGMRGVYISSSSLSASKGRLCCFSGWKELTC